MADNTDRRPTARGPTLLQAGRVGLFLLAGVWVILQNNARIGDSIPDHIGYSWLRIPRETRIVEAALLLAVFLVLQPLLARSRLRDLNALLWILITAAVIGVLRMPTNLVAHFQGIYVYVAPFLIYSVAWEASPDRRLLRCLITLFAAYLALSVSVALLVQFPEAGMKGDLIHGFFSDAHVLGSFLAIGSCVAFSRFLKAGGLGNLVLSGFLFFVSLFPVNEKAIIFNVIWYAVVLARRLISHPRGRRGLVTAAAACVLALGLTLGRRDDSEPLTRIDLLFARSVSELGPARAWVLSWHAISDSPVDLTIGLGPANFAGLAAQRTVQEQQGRLGTFRRSARDVLADEPGAGGAMDLVANTWSNLLAEFGLIGFGAFALALIRVSLPLYRWRPAAPFDRLVRSAFLVMLSVIVWQGCFTPYTNWADPVLVYPMMVLAAYCHRAMPRRSPVTRLQASRNMSKWQPCPAMERPL